MAKRQSKAQPASKKSATVDVRLLKSIAFFRPVGGQKLYQEGDVLTTSPTEAARLIEKGIAEAV